MQHSINNTCGITNVSLIDFKMYNVIYKGINMVKLLIDIITVTHWGEKETLIRIIFLNYTIYGLVEEL